MSEWTGTKCLGMFPNRVMIVQHLSTGGLYYIMPDSLFVGQTQISDEMLELLMRVSKESAEAAEFRVWWELGDDDDNKEIDNESN